MVQDQPKKDYDDTQFVMRQITSRDWQAYRDFYKGLDPQESRMFDGYLAGRDLDAHETYANLFANTINKEPKGSFVMFGLWHEGKMIGQTSLDFECASEAGKNIVAFEGDQITNAYRGRGLADKLYETRKQYLRDIGFNGVIRIAISPDKERSLKAAKRNGFRDTGELNRIGRHILVYEEENLNHAPAIQVLPVSAGELDKTGKSFEVLIANATADDPVPPPAGKKNLSVRKQPPQALNSSM